MVCWHRFELGLFTTLYRSKNSALFFIMPNLIAQWAVDNPPAS